MLGKFTLGVLPGALAGLVSPNVIEARAGKPWPRFLSVGLSKTEQRRIGFCSNEGLCLIPSTGAVAPSKFARSQ